TPVNEEIVVDGVTVVMNGEYRDYTDIESALRSENISILYPQSLPNEIHIKKLMYYNENNINKLSIITTKDTLTIEVVFDSNMPKEIYDTTVFSEKINSLECYIIDMPDIKYTQIYFECKDKWYVFSGDKKQELVEIIENLKELE
ncbi:MAG: hypothetical protein J6Q87_06665, partial [Clostridia bacterium]|nr:hypothetical protein [Clostridia bacterium]